MAMSCSDSDQPETGTSICLAKLLGLSSLCSQLNTSVPAYSPQFTHITGGKKHIGRTEYKFGSLRPLYEWCIFFAICRDSGNVDVDPSNVRVRVRVRVNPNPNPNT